MRRFNKNCTYKRHEQTVMGIRMWGVIHDGWGYWTWHKRYAALAAGETEVKG